MKMLENKIKKTHKTKQNKTKQNKQNKAKQNKNTNTNLTKNFFLTKKKKKKNKKKHFIWYSFTKSNPYFLVMPRNSIFENCVWNTVIWLLNWMSIFIYRSKRW